MDSILKILITILLSTTITSAFADTLTVKQDGTGDHTIIQDAITASSDGDTILVWPGTYYENVDFIGKNITLASLMLTTGDDLYKHNTIIDGNQSGSCVVFMADETDAALFGFTLQNGSGYREIPIDETFGGGVYMNHASASIYNCIIKDNRSSMQSGGVHCDQFSNLFLSGTSIFRNQSLCIGGLYFGYRSIVTFDNINKCSIYNNYACSGCDIQHSNHDTTMHLVLDTFSVLNPTPYFISSTDDYGYQIYNYTYSIDNAFFNPIDADVYVNPVSGDNTNSGTSPDEAFSTIAWALSNIAVDTNDKNTIHLANGTYSDSANNERFPLNVRPFTNFQGESRENVILDGRHLIPIFKGNTEVSDYSFKNLTMNRGGYVKSSGMQLLSAFGDIYQQNDNIVFDSILFINGWSSQKATLQIIRCNNVTIKNCEFKNTIGGSSLDIDSVEEDTMWVHNCKFIDNMPDYNNPEYTMGVALIAFGENSVKVVTNSLFTGNNQQTVSNWLSNNLYLVNCTFTNNTLITNTYPSIVSHDGNLHMYNCISYNEGNTPLSLSYNESQDTVIMEIYNSLIEGGLSSISVQPGLTKLYYDETNIDADPLFYGGPDFPYNLSDDSPCIDAGTLNLPEWIELPETDLAGNPRVFNDEIDMGAYEWNPTVGIDENHVVNEREEKLLTVAPNPFSRSATISVSFSSKADIRVDIFNTGGKRVKTLIKGLTLPGTSQLQWHGDDMAGNKLPSGIYFVVMFEDNKEVANSKVILNE